MTFQRCLIFYLWQNHCKDGINIQYIIANSLMEKLNLPVTLMLQIALSVNAASFHLYRELSKGLFLQTTSNNTKTKH